MNTSPENQQNLQQQSPATQLLHCQTAPTQTEQLICTTDAAIPTLLPQLDPTVLVKTGGSPAAIILSIALSLAVVIFALAEYNKVFLPVMLQKPDEKSQ